MPFDDTELESLLRDLESDRAERKASPSDTNRLREVICTFANDLPDHRQPGVLFVGVEDDGTCSHLKIDDRLLSQLAQMRSDGAILPFPTMTVRKVRLAGCELAVVEVEPAAAPPIRFRGRVWVRVGPSRAIASPEEERRLIEKHRAKDLPFDLRPITNASLDALDLPYFRDVYLPNVLPAEVLVENQRSHEQQLQSLRLLTNDPEPQPTFLGLLAVGRSPRDHVPGAYIQFLRLEGTELTAPVKNQKEIDGPLDAMLKRLDDTLQNHISTTADITTASRELRRFDYPLAALQQLVRNAVLHRNYEGTHAPVRVTWFDDRIEIMSPGGPFGQVTAANFGTPGVTDYRNPNLAAAMKDLGYVQRFGVGIPIAREQLRANGNPPPQFVAQPSHIAVVVGVRP